MPLTSAAYDSLRDCARRRIEEEWELTGREQAVLRVIERLSFGCRQMRACIEKQSFLATACGMQRSEVCRVLGNLVRKGALSCLKHQREILYAIELECESVPQRSPVTSEQREQAMEQLLQIQENRRGGEADSNGQLRIRGMFGPPEDIRLERTALAAEMERPPPAPAEEPTVSQDEIQRELDALRSRLPIARDLVRDPEADPRAREVDRYRDGLTHDQQHVWDCLVAEVLSGAEEGWKDFKQYAGTWRKRVRLETNKIREAVGDHKLRRIRQGPAARPGAWIYSRLQL